MHLENASLTTPSGVAAGRDRPTTPEPDMSRLVASHRPMSDPYRGGPGGTAPAAEPSRSGREQDRDDR
jgi:hypothetical protein